MSHKKHNVKLTLLILENPWPCSICLYNPACGSSQRQMSRASSLTDIEIYRNLFCISTTHTKKSPLLSKGKQLQQDSKTIKKVLIKFLIISPPTLVNYHLNHICSAVNEIQY